MVKLAKHIIEHEILGVDDNLNVTYLKLDGSNANSDIDIGNYDFDAAIINATIGYFQKTASGVGGLVEIKNTASGEDAALDIMQAAAGTHYAQSGSVGYRLMYDGGNQELALISFRGVTPLYKLRATLFATPVVWDFQASTGAKLIANALELSGTTPYINMRSYAIGTGGYYNWLKLYNYAVNDSEADTDDIINIITNGDSSTRILSLLGDLYVENLSTIYLNQDLTTDASVSFLDITATNASIIDGITINSPSENALSMAVGTTTFQVEADCTITQDLNANSSPQWGGLTISGNAYLTAGYIETFRITNLGDLKHLGIAATGTFSADRILSIDLSNGDRTLIIEANSTINQDLTSDATVTFGSITSNGNITLENGEYIDNATDQQVWIGSNGGTYPSKVIFTLGGAFGCNLDIAFDTNPGWSPSFYFERNIILTDSRDIVFGAGSDAKIRWCTAGNDHLFIGTLANSANYSGNIIFGNSAANNDNYAHATSADPYLLIHSYTRATTATDQWIGIKHNQTDAEINTGKGNLNIVSAGGKVDITGTINTTSDDDWDLNDYTAGTVADTGYVAVTINGTAYKLLARLEP